MQPVVELNRVLSSYLRGECTLEELKLGIVPLLPYFAERLDSEPAARLVVDLDSILIEIETGESTEADVRSLVEARMPTPTTELRYPATAPRLSSESGSRALTLQWSPAKVRTLFTAGEVRLISGHTPHEGAFA